MGDPRAASSMRRPADTLRLSMNVLVPILVIANVWAALMWRGGFARAWLERAAARENWDWWYSPKKLTVGVLPFVLFLDLIPVNAVTYQLLGVRPGQAPIDWLITAPMLASIVLWFSVGGWDRPAWLLPPWYRRWKAARTGRGHDASHQISVVCVRSDDGTTQPYVFAQCECDWLSEVITVSGEDFAAALEELLRNARKHSRNIKRTVEFPFGRPATAPHTLR